MEETEKISNYTYDNNQKWDFGLLEGSDMSQAIEISMESFFRPRLNVAASEASKMNPVERVIMKGVVGVFTGVEQSDARFSNYLGYASRANKRLNSPNLRPGRDSVILVAAEKGSEHLAGLVEISLEPPDGRLGPPVKSPLRRDPRPTDETYLCNLCVAGSQRRQGLATMLCRLCEDVTRNVWKKDRIYLHVESGNVPAQELYVGQGYELVQSPLSPWEIKMFGMENILYYCKELVESPSSETELCEPNNFGIYSGEEEHALGITEKDLKIASNTMKGTLM